MTTFEIRMSMQFGRRRGSNMTSHSVTSLSTLTIGSHDVENMSHYISTDIHTRVSVTCKEAESEHSEISKYKHF